MSTQVINKLPVGQKFYYTGDMANNSDFGEILEVIEPTKYTPLSYKCKFESGKERVIMHLSFNKGIGQRFKTIEQCNEERAAQMQVFYSQYPHLKNANHASE